MNIRIPSTYEFEFEEKLDDVNGFGTVCRHKKTGAKIVLINNKDDNKVFYIGFRTPPKNSTGVAHILEHSVLCGSKNFPSKEPFVELIKGSLNTFLNAMTYPDKTVYPVASCNDADFQNLIHVYLDAVFYPNIYEKEEIFLQEGWHYDLEDLDAPLKYNGVVYNEMKGVFSSPEQELFRRTQNSLFPDNAYGVESGGDPEFIPELSYEEFLDFHKTYYHPSNSFIYLYGDMDFTEKLTWLDENYLRDFKYLDVDSEIEYQDAFKEPKEQVEYYSISENESEKDNTYLSSSVVIGDSLDKELTLAFQVLEYILLQAPGAPIKKALLNKGIGKDILSSFQDGILQPMFSIIAKNSNSEDKEVFISTIKGELEKIVKKGIDEKSLKAAINFYEFRYLEADFGSYPKGLIYGLQVLSSWIYDDNQPFLHLHDSKGYNILKDKIGTKYYEDLIEEYLLNNNHRSTLILKPKVGLLEEKDQALIKKLEEYKKSLSHEEIMRIIEGTKKLKAYQEEPSRKEDIAKIPLLNREDISTESQPLYNELEKIDGVKLLHHNIHTNGIAYIRFLFDISDVPQKLIPYMSLLTNVLGLVDTKNYSYLQLSNEINISTGGIGVDVKSFAKKSGKHRYLPVFEFSTKVLGEKIDEALVLIDEIMHHTKLDDHKRLEEIFNELKSRMEMRFNSSGHAVAVDRAMSYYSEHGLFKEQLSGIAFYDFLKDVTDNFNERIENVVESFNDLIKTIFTKDKLIISITTDDKGLSEIKEELPVILDTLNHKEEVDLKGKYNQEQVLPTKLNEGYKYSSQVQYVARAGNFKDAGFNYSGALKVLKVILSFDYLWNNIRVKGGAYGCMCGFSSIDGDGYFTSYRDPNLKVTNEVYKDAPKYIREFTADDRDITKYIIGTISNEDTPLTAKSKGARSLSAYFTGITMEDIEKERSEILNITVEEIRKTADIVESVLNAGNICVLGSENKIKEDKELFMQVKDLI